MRAAKKSLAMLLTLIMILGLTVPALAAKGENPFTDVPANAYYHDAVIWAKDTGVTTGVTANQFQPEGTCTRGQVATFLWRAKGQPEPGIENPFKDVSASSPFYKAILWAYENGITTGVTADTFNPNGTCTNAHVVTFLWRAFGEPAAIGASTTANAYPAGTYYKDAVAWADSKGLLSNMGGAFMPNEKAPRANIVTYLYRSSRDEVIYDYVATNTSHKDASIETNTSYKWERYYQKGAVPVGTWNEDTEIVMTNFHNTRNRLPAGENLWFTLTRMPEIQADRYQNIYVTLAYVWNKDRGNAGDMKVQDYGFEIFVSSDNGTTWSQAAATMAGETSGTRVTIQETEKDHEEGYLYKLSSTDLLKISGGKNITDLRIYPYGTKSEDCRCAFSLTGVTISGTLANGVEPKTSGYDPGVKVGDPWASNAALSEYEIYHFAPDGKAFDGLTDLRVRCNSNRAWTRTGTLNGNTEKTIPVLCIYNNVSTSGGLTGKETMTLDLYNAPDLDTSVFGAANLQLRYFYVQDDSDLNIRITDEMEVLVSTDNGRSWASKKAGLRSQEMLGAMTTDDGKKGVYYEVTSEDLTDLVPAGAVITDIRFKPFGDYVKHWGAFRVGEISVVGYKTALPAVEQKEIGTIKVDPNTLREVALHQAEVVATREWTAEKDINTYNWAGSYGVSTSLPMKYYAGWLHRGPVYTRVTEVSGEQWETFFKDGVYQGGYTDNDAPGMACGTLVYDGFSRFSGNFEWNSEILITHPENMPLVAPLTNEKHYVTSAEIIDAHTEQQVYQQYANVHRGDVMHRVPDGTHIRFVSRDPYVVYRADGTIDPAQSYVLMTESAGTVYYNWKTPTGETVRSTGDPAVYQKDHPDYTYLFGASHLVDERYTFTALYEKDYIAHTFEEYINGEVQELQLNMVTEATPETVVEKGLTVGLESNYRMISIEAKILQGDKEVFSTLDYQGMRRITCAYSSEKLNIALKELPAGDYKLVLDVTAGPVLTVGGEVPVTRVLDMDFTASGATQKAPRTLNIIKGGFGGYDLGFNASGAFFCFRVSKPEGTSWENDAPDSFSFSIKDSSGKEIMSEAPRSINLGLATSASHQVGRGPGSMKNGYNFENVRGLKDVSMTVTVVDNGITYTGTATGLTVAE